VGGPRGLHGITNLSELSPISPLSPTCGVAAAKSIGHLDRDGDTITLSAMARRHSSDGDIFHRQARGARLSYLGTSQADQLPGRSLKNGWSLFVSR